MAILRLRRRLYRLLQAVAPRPAEALLDIHLSVRERRPGRRVAVRLGRETSDFVTQLCFEELRGRAEPAARDLAVLTVLPRADTGIANFALRTFTADQSPIDLYTVPSSKADFIALKYNPVVTGSVASVLDMDLLPFGEVAACYRAVVLELGNSAHHIPSLRAALGVARRGRATVYLHLHDPMILDFLHAWCAAEGADLFALLQRSYGDQILAHRAAIKAGQFAPVLARGICGAAALLDLVPAAAAIVNSTVAQDLLRRDAPRFPGERIWQLYHPVFAVDGEQLARPDELTIGAFGLPSPSKLTERVVEAFREVRARRPGARLIIAGYQAGAYAAAHGLREEANVSWLDSPLDEEFGRLMRACHVAVQLRSANFGESSGVVPQLLAVGTPTIVSKLGAFTGFGDAVAYFDPGGSAIALADLIMAEAGHGGERKAAMRRYVEAHPAERFCSDLRRLILADLDGTGEPDRVTVMDRAYPVGAYTRTPHFV